MIFTYQKLKLEIMTMDKSFIISASDNLRPSTEGNEVKNFRSFHGLNNSHKHPVAGKG